jgi:hypothetical protein
MATEYTEFIYEQVAACVARVTRNLQRGALPKHVQAYLPYYRAEGSIRRDMGAMWQSGQLMRIGRAGSRRGYRVPKADERFLFEWIPAAVRMLGRMVDAEEVAEVLNRQDIEMVRGVLNWLADCGKVVALDNGSYRAPTQLERMAWKIGGTLPYGVTRVA